MLLTSAQSDNRSSPAQRYLAFALPCLALLIKSYTSDVRIAEWPLEVSGYPVLRDFANLWSGGVAALSGQFNSLFDNTRHAGELGRLLGISPPHLIWSYPPTAMLAMTPLALLPYVAACVVWLTASATLFAFAAGVFGQRSTDARRLMGAIILSPGVFLCLAYGQTALLTASALAIGLRYVDRRPMLASVCLGLLAAKPQIALVVPVALIAMRCWRTLLGTAMVVATYVVATVVTLGMAPWRIFLDVTVPQQLAILNAPSFDLAMMISPYFVFRGIGFSVGVSYVLQVGVALAVIAWLFIVLQREKDRNIQVLMVGCGSLLVSPYMQTYELPVLVLAVASICVDERSSALLGDSWLTAVIASVTVIPFVVLTMLTWSGTNFTALVPLALLIALGRRALVAHLKSLSCVQVSAVCAVG